MFNKRKRQLEALNSDISDLSYLLKEIGYDNVPLKQRYLKNPVLKAVYDKLVRSELDRKEAARQSGCAKAPKS